MDKPIEIIEIRKAKSREDKLQNIRWSFLAAKAWESLGEKRPQRIEILKKFRVFRLKTVGTGSSSDVIAKRLDNDKNGVLPNELTIYEKILPRLPIATLHYYGYVSDPSSGYWLFIEDADGEEFSSSIRQHRILAAEWLGIMHTSTERISKTFRIPNYGPSYYLSIIDSAKETLFDNSKNSRLEADAETVLHNIVSQFDHLEARWDKIEQLFTEMPQTLIHGDFISCNISIRVAKSKPSISCFDWEHAGTGVPAVDLQSLTCSAKPDLAAYRKTVRSSWNLSMDTIHQIEKLGNLFRCIKVIGWDSPFLTEQWAIEDLKLFSTLLSKTISKMNL